MEWNRDKERKTGKAMGIGTSIFALVFIVIWCITAAGMGAWFMLIFGLPMLGFMIFRLAVILRNTKETPKEPWEQPEQPRSDSYRTSTQKFCPYCSKELETDFVFCPICGRRLS